MIKYKLIISNFERSLVVKKVHHLLYFSKLIEGITEGTIIGPIEGLIKSSSLGIYEKVSEE